MRVSKLCPICRRKNSYIIIQMELVDNDSYFRMLKCRSCNNIWKEIISLIDVKYYLISVPGYKKAIPISHWVWEQVNHRKLLSGELIHHISGIDSDNRPSNLLSMPVSEHSAYLNSSHPYNRIKILEERIRELEEQLCQS